LAGHLGFHTGNKSGKPCCRRCASSAFAGRAQTLERDYSIHARDKSGRTGHFLQIQSVDGFASGKKGGFPIRAFDRDLASIQEMREAVSRAKEAHARFRAFSQEQVDRIVKSIAEAAYKEAASLARLAVEETGIGVVEHKKLKNELGSMGVYESIKDEKTVGIIRKNSKDKIVEIAYPFGVIAAICPTTNPTSTAIFKTLIALKAQNAIVASPHPSAVTCTIAALKICHDAAVEAGAPEGLIGWIPQPSIETTLQLMKHRDVSLILATGGGRWSKPPIAPVSRHTG
ncbi:aldehyde dehydrogenase family protein, partial [Citrobacter freundii]|uniref:aldehyde dehydrogenase family protein n=1 Tax=Citrobacter freundii TaxID=546 RepID=UPI001B7FBF1B